MRRGWVGWSSALSAVVFAIVGCSGSHGSSRRSGARPPAPSDARDAEAPDAGRVESFELQAPPANQWAALLQIDWALAPGSEAFWCKRVSVQSDFWIRGFRAIAPTGTHHVTLSKA